MKLPVIGTVESCTCQDCIIACYHKPGWFAPNEIEKVADFMGISLQQLFDEYLGVDWYVLPSEMNKGMIKAGGIKPDDVITPEQFDLIQEEAKRVALYVIAPAHDKMKSGGMYPADPEGKCVLLDENDRCKIHLVKPEMCRESYHDNRKKSITTASAENKRSATEWTPYLGQVTELLGREPEPARPEALAMEFSNADPVEIFAMLLDMAALKHDWKGV